MTLAASSQDVHGFSQFFNHLVELIPTKYYRSDEDGRVDLQHMKKAERLAAQQEFKAKAKQAKRAKLGDASAGTNATDEDGDGDEEDTAPSTSAKKPEAGAKQVPLLNIPTGNLSRGELQEKLQQKIQAMRQQREHHEKQQNAKKAKDWKQKTLEQNAKRKQQQEQSNREQQKGIKRKAEAEAEPAAAPKQQQQQQQGHRGAQGQKQQQQDEKGTGLAFPRIEVDEGRPGQMKGGKKLSKEQLLKIAEAKQREKEKGTEEIKPKLAQEAWKSAVQRASGERVLDDPKLLRKSLKKEAKRKEKHSKAWGERLHAQKEHMAARQNKRKENLQKRITGNAEKKKDRREKKLLRGGAADKKAPRAGFEGRRASFIGDKGGAKS